MQSMLDKYERHLSEIQANVRVLTAERDKTRMCYQQVEHSELNSHLQALASFIVDIIIQPSNIFSLLIRMLAFMI